MILVWVGTTSLLDRLAFDENAISAPIEGIAGGVAVGIGPCYLQSPDQ